MDHKLISQLRPGNVNFKIKVRIARFWESINPQDDKLMSLEAVVIDEKASVIQATMKANDANYFQQLLKEGDACLISNFVVAPTSANFRAVANGLLLRFTRMTSFKKLEDSVELPMHTFTFAPFLSLPSRVRRDALLTDVIGRIVSVGHVEVVYIKDRATKKNLHIEDLSGDRLQVTLWDKIAEDFPESMILEQQLSVVVVFAGMTVRIFNQNICVCSCSATKYYFDLCIPKVVEFRLRLPDLPGASTLHIEEEKSQLSLEQQVNDNRRNVLELRCLFAADQEMGEAMFSCEATILDIDRSERWWYRACPSPTCKVGLTEFEDKFWCNKCASLKDSYMPWYRVTFVVKDQTGEISFTAFENVVAGLVGIPASSFANDARYKDRFSLPPVLLNLLGKTCLQGFPRIP